MRIPFTQESKTEPGKYTLEIPKEKDRPQKMNAEEMREYMRSEYKRLSQNLESVKYESLDDESKYNYIICKI